MGMYLQSASVAVVTLPTKLPAKANVIGAGMFLGLLFLM